MGDAGYQFVKSVIFVMVKRDFCYSQLLQGNRLGLGSDVVVELGLGEGLFIGGSRGDFLNLACLIINNGRNPRVLTAFVADLYCAADFAVDLLEAGDGFAVQLLLAVDLVCHDLVSSLL